MARPPALTAYNIDDDSDVDTFIGVVLDSPNAIRRSRHIRRLQAVLRRQLTEAQWRAYLAIEQAGNERVAEESRTIARAAWDDGRRHGRRERRR